MVVSTLKLGSALLALAFSCNGAVVANTPIKLPLSRHVNTTSLRNIVELDRARTHMLLGSASGNPVKEFNAPLANVVSQYIASIGVGSPPTYFDVIVDTGSSNTWVGAQGGYVATNSSKKTSETVSVRYGSGSFTGVEYIDHVELASGLTIRQSIGVATQSKNVPYDGILGLGPADLTLGSLSPHSNITIPTVTDNAYRQGYISSDIIGISFRPFTSTEALTGELSWGGVDQSMYTGSIIYAPITSTFPSNLFWGVDLFMMYGSGTLILGKTAGFTDTGTTMIRLATEAYAAYVRATGSQLDQSVGLLSISSSSFSTLQSLFLEINGVSFELTASAQTWPRSLNDAIGGRSDRIYLIVTDLGTQVGSGMDFVLGQFFSERFYLVYDTDKRRLGFANTSFTFAETS